MPLSRNELVERINCLVRISSEFDVRVDRCVSKIAAARRQKQFDPPIPQEISNFAQQTASRVFISCNLDHDKFPDEEFDFDLEVFGFFDFNFFETDLSALEGWEDSFVNWKNYRDSPNPFRFEDIFPVFQVANGDLIVSIIDGEDLGAIYYMDHECGDGDWRRLADSYEQFIDTLAKLWFPPLDWYNSLELFYDNNRRIITADCDLARQVDVAIRNMDLQDITPNR